MKVKTGTTLTFLNLNTYFEREIINSQYFGYHISFSFFEKEDTTFHCRCYKKSNDNETI